MPAIPKSKYAELRKLYESGATMAVVARNFGVSLNAVVYAMRKASIPRRSLKEARNLRFDQQAPSFQARTLKNESELITATMGISLYWAEGYKTEKAMGIDFANSDPSMITAFMKFLRTCYKLDENRFRISLYAYSDQNIPKLIEYWSNLTNISRSKFTKPYIRQDFRTDGRKMPYGLVHIRYADKKLLYDILGRINRLKMTI